MVEVGEKAPQTKRILVVDDEQDWQDIFQARVENIGGEAVITNSIKEATGALKQGSFSGAVVDGLKGGWKRVWEVAKQKSVPCLVASASASVISEAMAEKVPVLDKSEIKKFEDIDKVLLSLMARNPTPKTG